MALRMQFQNLFAAYSLGREVAAAVSVLAFWRSSLPNSLDRIRVNNIAAQHAKPFPRFNQFFV
jgi:hypothetical protein